MSGLLWNSCAYHQPEIPQTPFFPLWILKDNVAFRSSWTGEKWERLPWVLLNKTYLHSLRKKLPSLRSES